MSFVFQENYVRFQGQYAELKRMGYEFVKSRPGDRLQWRKGRIRVFKKGHDVTMDRIRHEHFVGLAKHAIELNGELPFVDKKGPLALGPCLDLYYNRENGEVTFDGTAYFDWMALVHKKHEAGEAIPVPIWESTILMPEEVAPLQELVRKGWISVEPYKAAGN